MKRQRPKIQNESEYAKLSDKDSDEETEMFVRKQQFREIPTIEKTIEEGDTLQAVSIRYHCTIGELKRLNNIHKENEIFAKNTIKVPARPILLALADVHTSGTTSPKENGYEEINVTEVGYKLNDKLIHLSSNNSQAESEVNDVIFNSNVKPIDKPCDKADEHLVNEVSEEEIHLLPKQPPVAENVVSRLSCSGADADISWIALIVCIVIVIFAVPLIYVFYVAEHPEQFHHHNHNS